MRMLRKTIAALGFVGAMAMGTPTATNAQGIYFEGPGVGFGIGAPYRYHRYRYYDRPYAYDGYRAWGYERPYRRHYRYYDRW